MTDNEANNKTQREMLMDLTVSAGVQEHKLDTVIITLKDHCASEEKWRAATVKRLTDVEIMQARQDERLTHTARNITGINAIYATVVGVVAGIFGAKS